MSRQLKLVPRWPDPAYATIVSVLTRQASAKAAVTASGSPFSVRTRSSSAAGTNDSCTAPLPGAERRVTVIGRRLQRELDRRVGADARPDDAGVKLRRPRPLEDAGGVRAQALDLLPARTGLELDRHARAPTG